MPNTSNTYPDYLYNIISGFEDVPADNQDNYEWLKPLKLSINAYTAPTFYNNIDRTLLHLSKKRNDERETATLRYHWEIILLNLTFIMYQRCWLLVPEDKKLFESKSPWLNSLDLRWEQTKLILDFLVDRDLIEISNNGVNSESISVRKIFPRPSLMWMIWQHFLDIEQPIEPPYSVVRSPSVYPEPICDLLSQHPNRQELQTINEFLRPHSWACKAPVQLIYDDFSCQVGRLYTPFQRLPNNGINLRIHTLLDGEPICEVGFNANHLRLNQAINGGANVGSDPYEKLNEKTGALGIEKIKIFLEVGMRSDCENKANDVCRALGINGEEFNKLKAATHMLFPTLGLFCGWDAHAQNFETAIIKDVMLQGVQDDVITLPLHDKIAVKQSKVEWAIEVMKNKWNGRMKVVELAQVETEFPND